MSRNPSGSIEALETKSELVDPVSEICSILLNLVSESSSINASIRLFCLIALDLSPISVTIKDAFESIGCKSWRDRGKSY